MQRITAPDGAGIVLHSTGSGPDLVVVHGGGVTIHEYRLLAALIADRFTVHLYNRRGRADAAPRREPYTVEQEIEDLGAVLAHTGARRAIGHSYGAFVVLRAALRLPLDRIAVYDARSAWPGTACRRRSSTLPRRRSGPGTPRGRWRSWARPSTRSPRRRNCRSWCAPRSAGRSCAPRSGGRWAAWWG
ncbi:hypothetical protein GCM10010169_43640 [Micromonospora fulviviridis]|uniref:alpha/beta fold hydrolase n=1 Tax=Micromonospora fulviviridis TaxID=47860 RepID=UPI0019CCA096|nr:alpha/beta fold hydrolase [Micromonospora fulviviridis]GGR94378.1 hypothetical protein GCM10010169_43640 [Micromonospora fulviviridis]